MLVLVRVAPKVVVVMERLFSEPAVVLDATLVEEAQDDPTMELLPNLLAEVDMPSEVAMTVMRVDPVEGKLEGVKLHTSGESNERNATRVNVALSETTTFTLGFEPAATLQYIFLLVIQLEYSQAVGPTRTAAESEARFVP